MTGLERLFDQRRVVSAGVILAALLLSAAAGRVDPLPLVALVVVILGALYLLKKPQNGIWLLLFSSLCVPLQIGTGSQTALHIGILLIPVLLVVWIADMLRRKDVRLVPSIANLPALVFIAVATLALLAGQMPWSYFAQGANLRAQVGGWSVFVLSVGVFLLVGNLLKGSRGLQVLTYTFLALGALEVAGRLVPALPAVLQGVVLDKAAGSLFWIWLIALAVGQALFNRSLGTAARLTHMGLAVAALGVGWFLGRDWVSGWLPGIVSLGALLWLRSWRLGAIATVVIAILLMLNSGVMSDVATADQYSLNTRQAAWDIVLNKVLPSSPILGLGPANYYHYTPLYRIMGYSVKFNSHNQYVDILAQTGIVGLAVFLWFMAAIGWVGWQLRERVGDGFARGYVYACLAGLVGTVAAGMLGDWFLPFVYNIGLSGFRASILGWIFLGGIVALGSSDRNDRIRSDRVHKPK